MLNRTNTTAYLSSIKIMVNFECLKWDSTVVKNMNISYPSTLTMTQANEYLKGHLDLTFRVFFYTAIVIF